MAALPKSSWNDPSSPIKAAKPPLHILTERPQPFVFSEVFRGHKLIRKDRHLSSGLTQLDALIDGGILRGRISEITGRAGSGKTSIAASFAAFSTQIGEIVAWLDASGAFDPESMAAAGVKLGRMLWASTASRTPSASSPNTHFPTGPRAGQSAIIKATELVLEAGGFGLVVVDFGEAPRALAHASALRIAHAAERSGAAVIVIAPWRMCGTFAALSLTANRIDMSFSRLAPGSPTMFDGLAMDATVARNKMGGTGRRVRVRALVDPVTIPNPADLRPYSSYDDQGTRVRVSASR